MSDNHRFCLLGFAPESEKRIKKIIENEPAGQGVAWTTANDSALSGVIINAAFLATPQIQKFLGHVNLPVVCAYNNQDGKALAEKYRHLAIDLHNPQDVLPWLQTLFGKAVRQEATPSAPAKAQQEAPAVQVRHTSSSTANRPIQNDTQALLNHIRRRDAITIKATAGDSTTWIKPSAGLVFIDYPRESVPGFDRWQWQEVDESAIPDTSRQLKIDLWIFESIWQSEIDGSKYVDNHSFYQLTRWPQPLNRHGRTEALRLAACAQSYPVNLDILHEKTNYPHHRIKRFIFATLLAGQTEIVGKPVMPRQAEAPQDERKIAEKRSLLQRFREKLGL